MHGYRMAEAFCEGQAPEHALRVVAYYPLLHSTMLDSQLDASYDGRAYERQKAYYDAFFKNSR